MVRSLQAPLVMEQFEKLWDMTRPYSHEELPVVLMELKLAALDIGNELKVSSWIEVVMQELLVPRILEGESHSCFLLEGVIKALAELEHDLGQDLDDVCVGAISSMEEVLTSLKGLLVTDPLKQLSYINQVQQIKDMQRKYFTSPGQCSGFLCLVSRSTQELLGECEGTQVHQATMQETELWLKENQLCSLKESEVAGFIKILQDLSALQVDAPASTTSKLLSQAREMVAREWAWYQSCIEKSIKPPYEVGSLSNLISEALICFPEDQEVVDAQLKMSKWVVEVAGQSKLQKLFSTLETLQVPVAAVEPEVDISSAFWHEAPRYDGASSASLVAAFSGMGGVPLLQRSCSMQSHD